MQALRKDVILRPVLESIPGVVGGRRTIGNLYIVAVELVESNHLLSTLDTLAWIVAAVGWGLCGRDLVSSFGPSHLALVASHVHVGLTAASRDLAELATACHGKGDDEKGAYP
jgi:hypothetical protein